VKGQVDVFHADASTSSVIDAFELTAQNARVTASTSSAIDVKATKELSADASASSAIRYAGSPAKVTKSANTSSSIEPR
jgi:hypothetical protein